MAHMNTALHALTQMPSPQFVMSAEGRRIATYLWGETDAPVVLCVHGFASSCRDNWVATGWVRDLTRAGFSVLGVDQLGHGSSDKPHEASEYGMDALVDAGGYAAARERGTLRLEGRDYSMADGDVITVKFTP